MATEDNTQPNPVEETAATQNTEPATDATPETAETDLTTEQIARFEYLNTGARGEPENNEVEEEAVQPSQRQAPSPATVADGGIDIANLAKKMVTEFGAGAGEIAETLGNSINTLVAENKALREQIESVLGLPDEIKKIAAKVDPIAQRDEQRSQREAAQQVRSVHEFFDGQAEYGDMYGKGDPKSHTPTNRLWRQAIAQKAADLMDVAEKRGDPLTLGEALKGAQFLQFKGHVSRAGATNAVRTEVKKAARGVTVDPGRGTGARSAAPLTVEQERAKGLQNIDKVLAEAAQKRSQR